MPPSPCSAGTKFPSPDNFEQKPALDSAFCQSQGYPKANAKYVQSEHKANAEQAKQALRIRNKALQPFSKKQSKRRAARASAEQTLGKRRASAEQAWSKRRARKIKPAPSVQLCEAQGFQHPRPLLLVRKCCRPPSPHALGS